VRVKCINAHKTNVVYKEWICVYIIGYFLSNPVCIYGSRTPEVCAPSRSCLSASYSLGFSTHSTPEISKSKKEDYGKNDKFKYMSDF
jgi:hypothetical protein